MQIICLLALTIYLPIWLVFHPTYLLKNQRTIIDGDKHCILTYKNDGATTTIVSANGEWNPHFVFVKSECKPTGLLPIQPQWKWSWEDDEQWRNEAIEQPL